MSSCSGSVRSFDNDSELTLLNGDSLDQYDEYQNDKIAYQVDTRSYPNPANNLLLSSSSSLARCLAGFAVCLRVLIPSFLLQPRQSEARQERLHPTAYLDGMRGLAAFAVFMCHLSYGTWDTTHVYGAGEPGENNHLLQLPVVRLLYGGPPMVAIFFVISGYALSYKPVRLMRAQKHEELMVAMTSSVFRRAFRLFLPCFASTLLVVCLCQLGFYQRTEEFAKNMRAEIETHATTEPHLWSQMLDWVNQMFRFVNVFDWGLYAGTTTLDLHLWTIPAEYRCSLALFLTQILVARMSAKVRLSTLAGLAWWGAHWNRWEMVPFWAGAFLAELDHIKAAAQQSCPSIDVSLAQSTGQRPKTWSQKFWAAFYMMTFASGLYLASYPDAAGDVTPGYAYLDSLIPEYWTERHRFWPTIASVQIVWSVGNLSVLKSIFTSPPIRYIGNISFPLYVMHGPVIHTFGYMVGVISNLLDSC